MTFLKKLPLWYCMITKSLFRKASYWIILFLIPLLVLGMTGAAQSESGILHIVLCQNDPGDSLSQTVLNRLLNQKTIIHYTLADSEADATQAVVTGQADAAWILEDHFTRRFAKADAPVRILTTGDEPLLILAREQLYGAMAADYTRQVYLNFLSNEPLGTESVVHFQSSEESTGQGLGAPSQSFGGSTDSDHDRENLINELTSDLTSELDRLGDMEISGIAYYPAIASPSESDGQAANYLLLPLRGMLLLVILATALAAELYFIAQRNRGTFLWLTGSQLQLLHFIYLTAAMIPVAAIALASMVWIGIAGNPGTELAAMIFLVACFAGITTFLGKLIAGSAGHLQRVAAATPLILALTMVFGGVLLTPAFLRGFTRAFPTYYYIVGIQNPLKLWQLFIYAVISILIVFLPEHDI